MNLKELGEQFRAERERKGLSIAEVVQRTKISKTNVLALEAGDPKNLPHPVYAKGFVRNYARLLGLDPEGCVAIMAANYVAEDNVSAPQPTLDGPELEIAPGGRSRSGFAVFLAGILAIALLAGGVFLLTSREEAPRQEQAPAAQEQAPAAQEQPAAAPEQPAAPDAGEPAPAQDGAQEPAPAPDGGEPASAPAPQGSQDIGAAAAAPAAPAATQAALAAPAPGPAAPAPAPARPEPAPTAAPERQGPQRLVVAAREACWIFARVDGGQGPAVDIVLQPGQSHALHFNTGLELKLGNAGGVSVTLNGEPVALQAHSGQVRTLTFTAP